MKKKKSTVNVRYKAGGRERFRKYFRNMEAPCGICKGRLGRIRYEEPCDANHPLSFVIDEIIPVSRYWLGGYSSPEQACSDISNLQAAHRICNARKGNKIGFEMGNRPSPPRKTIPQDGEWK